MADDLVPLTAGRLLTAAAYQRLADVPPELEWFANLGSKATRRAYEHALADFVRFAGLVCRRRSSFRSAPTPLQN